MKIYEVDFMKINNKEEKVEEKTTTTTSSYTYTWPNNNEYDGDTVFPYANESSFFCWKCSDCAHSNVEKCSECGHTKLRCSKFGIIVEDNHFCKEWTSKQRTYQVWYTGHSTTGGNL